MIVGSNVINAVNYLYHFIIGRLLGPADYGTLTTVISLIGLISVVPGTLGFVIIKYISAAKDKKDQQAHISWFNHWVWLVSILISLMSAISIPVLISFTRINQPLLFVLIALSFLFSLPSLFNKSVLQALLRFKQFVISSFIETLAKLILSIGLIAMGFGVGGAMGAFFLATVTGFWVSSYFINDQKGFKAEHKSLPPGIVRYTLPVLLQSIALTSFYSTDLVLVKHYFSAFDTGLYSALSSLSKIIFFGTGPISAVMFPMVSKRHAIGGEYKKIYQMSFAITALLCLIALTFYSVVPTLAIKILYGSAYLQASGLLVWFGISVSLFTLSSLILNYNLSIGRARAAIFPAIAAVLQILGIVLFHQTLWQVIIVSLSISALLLISLLIFPLFTNAK